MEERLAFWEHDGATAEPERTVTSEVTVGWRGWGAKNGLLYSPYRLTIWPRGHRLSCPREKMQLSVGLREPPHGIHAFREPELLYRWLGVVSKLDRMNEVYDEVVYGRVSLWGLVLEHSHGWRGEHAYPYDLFTQTEAVARKLRARYGVDVLSQEALNG